MYTKIPILGIDRLEWLRLRKKGIGGSDAAAVCGLNPYSSAMKVFHDKTSTDITDEDNEAMRQGRDLEDYVAQRFTEATGIKVRKSHYMYKSTRYPFMLADIDRFLVGHDAGLECKTASAFNVDQWEDDKIPIHYYIQCQHYMAVTGKKLWYIAVLIMGKEFKYKKIERDEELIQGLILLESHFWKEYVLPRRMPDPDGSKVCNEILTEHYKHTKKDSKIPLIGFDEKINRRNELDDLIKKMEKEKNEIDQTLKLYMGEHEIAENDRYRISWKSVDSERLDTNLLKTEKPEIYKEYLKVSSTRRFTVKTAA